MVERVRRWTKEQCAGTGQSHADLISQPFTSLQASENHADRKVLLLFKERVSWSRYDI